MTIIRKIFIKLCLLATILLTQQSCVTKALWRGGSYEENITQFFVGADGRYIALLGVSYHYVLSDNSGVFRKILALKQKGVLSVNKTKTSLTLDSNNNVSGTLVLSGPHSLLPIEDVMSLQSIGIYPDRQDNITISVKLTGRRYAAKYLNSEISRSDTSFKFKVYYSDSNLVKGVGKLAITPVTVAADAVLLIGKVMVSAFEL